MADYPGYDTFCRECGKPIIFIRTAKGKLMPCDATPVSYWRAEPGQGILIYQKSGRCERGTLSGLPSLCAGSGYKPHWTSCTHKRNNTTPAERTETPLQKAIREKVRREREAREAREKKLEERRKADERRREAEAAQQSIFDL